MGIIYCYTNNINGKKYIGQTINPSDRFSSHKSAAFNEKDQEYNSPLHRAFRKYGYENFTYEVLEEVDNIDDLNILEQYHIIKCNSLIPNGYNIRPGGKNCTYTMSDEHKDKLRWSRAKLTKEEVEELRIAYLNKKSPSKIFQEKYEGQMHYNSFLNIWDGKRYSNIMPEVFEKRHVPRIAKEVIRAIKIDREKGLTYKQLIEKYGVSKATVEGICTGKRHADVQI